jgi:hypothetical protein
VDKVTCNWGLENVVFVLHDHGPRGKCKHHYYRERSEEMLRDDKQSLSWSFKETEKQVPVLKEKTSRKLKSSELQIKSKSR